MALRDIKGKIRSVGKTRKVTRAMEAVSAVKMRKSQAAALGGRPYALAALAILSRLSGAGEMKKHPLTATRARKKLLLIVVTSDKGLAGSFNAAVLRKALEVVRVSGFLKENISIVALGRKAADFFTHRGYTILLREENIADTVSLTTLAHVGAAAIGAFTDERADAVIAVYTNFLTTLTQTVVARELLPLKGAVLGELVAGIMPTHGKFSAESRPALAPVFVPAYTIEPSEGEVLAEVLPRLFSVALYHALLESKASEHSARMVAMKNASEKAGELGETLTRKYNKARQSLITREVSEIIGGVEALA